MQKNLPANFLAPDQMVQMVYQVQDREANFYLAQIHFGQ
jgi:hypothetical protein